jgi:hypothetical protein
VTIRILAEIRCWDTRCFKLDGPLLCSGNVGVFGGYVNAEDFTKNPHVSGETLQNLSRECK